MKRRIAVIALGLAAALGLGGGIAHATTASADRDAGTVVVAGSSWS